MQYLKANLNQVVTILFFTALTLYFFYNQEALGELLSISWWVVVLLILLKTVRIFVTGLFTKYTMSAFNKRISVRETNYLSLLSSLGNFFGPILGGASIRAIYLKKKHDFEYSKFISTLYGFYIISFIAYALIGLVLLGYITYNQGQAQGSVAIALAFGGILIGNLALVVLPPNWLRRTFGSLNFIPKRLKRIATLMIDGWEVMRGNRKVLLKLTGLNFVVFGIVVVESTLLYGQFISHFTLESVILYTVLGTLSTLVSFTPGAIGIKEGIYLFAGSIIALSSEQILQIAAIDRSATFILLFITFTVIKFGRFDKKIS